MRAFNGFFWIYFWSEVLEKSSQFSWEIYPRSRFLSTAFVCPYLFREESSQKPRHSSRTALEARHYLLAIFLAFKRRIGIVFLNKLMKTLMSISLQMQTIGSRALGHVKFAPSKAAHKVLSMLFMSNQQAAPSLIPLFDTHAFVKSFFSHPTHCSCTYQSNPTTTTYSFPAFSHSTLPITHLSNSSLHSVYPSPTIHPS